MCKLAQNDQFIAHFARAFLVLESADGFIEFYHGMVRGHWWSMDGLLLKLGVNLCPDFLFSL